MHMISLFIHNLGATALLLIIDTATISSLAAAIGGSIYILAKNK